MARTSATPAPGRFVPPPPEVVAACAERAAARAEDERRRRAAARIAAAAVPGRYMSASLADCDPAVARWAALAAEGRWEGEAPFLLLAGANGVGKSHQACAALMALAPSATLAFCEMPEVVEACLADFGRNAEHEIARLSCAGALVIDELGHERATGRTAQWVFNLVHRRWKRRRPTVVVTNLDSRGLLDHYARCGDATMGRSIVSRIGSGVVVRLEGRDRRFSAQPGRAEP